MSARPSEARDHPLGLVLAEYNAAVPKSEQLSLNSWAKRAGISSSALYAIKAGRTRSNTMDTIRKLADAIGYSPTQLASKLGGDFSIEPQSVPVIDSPVLADILANPPESMDALRDVASGFIAAPITSETLAAHRIAENGVDRKQQPGGYAIFDWVLRDLENGRFYLIAHHGEFLVRKFLNEGHPRFEPYSMSEHPTIFVGSDTPPLVVGRVVGWFAFE